MDSAHRLWVSLLLLSAVTSRDRGVFGRAVNMPPSSLTAADQSSGSTLRTGAPRRWRRAVAETHRERCAELSAPWQQNATPVPQENATLLQLRVQPFSPGASRCPVFPGKSLFSFVRRVYRCCREGVRCGSVKGIPGRLRGDRDVEFLLTRDILSLTVLRAELHLQLSNPHHLDIRPVLSALAKRNLPTRYSLGSRVHMVELRVDLLFLLQSLQEAAGGVGGGRSAADVRQVADVHQVADARQVASPSPLQDADGEVWGPVLELGLVLGCSRAGSGVSCGMGGVHLSHTPFMALYYR